MCYEYASPCWQLGGEKTLETDYSGGISGFESGQSGSIVGIVDADQAPTDSRWMVYCFTEAAMEAERQRREKISLVMNSSCRGLHMVGCFECLTVIGPLIPLIRTKLIILAKLIPSVSLASP